MYHNSTRKTASVVALAMAGLLLSGLVAGTAMARTDITIGMQLEPPNLDPTGGAAAAIDEVVYANIFEGLTRFGPDGSVNPSLAASWTVSDDGLAYTFTLQSGVTFHDGSAFDANDVKFSLDRARGEDSTNAQKALFTGITVWRGVMRLSWLRKASQMPEPRRWVRVRFNFHVGYKVIALKSSSTMITGAPKLNWIRQSLSLFQSQRLHLRQC